MLPLKPSQIVASIRIAFALMRPVFIFGAPGIGKSSVVAQVVAAMPPGPDGKPWEMRDVRCALLDPVDMRGMPVVDPITHTTVWSPPDWWPTNAMVAAGRAAARGVVFFDELNTAQASIQSAALQAIHDRRLGEAVLADGWCMAAAGNQTGQGTTAQRLSTALGSRFCLLEMLTDLDDFCRWAMRHGIAHEVIAYLRTNPAALHEMPAKGSQEPFPTSRTWEFTSDVVNHVRGSKDENLVKVSPEVHALFAGYIGRGHASQFVSFVEMASQLPSLDGILMAPESAVIPTSPAALYCVAYGLATVMNDDNIANAIKYLNRMRDEYNVLAIRAAVDRDKELTKTREYVRWIVAHSGVV